MSLTNDETKFVKAYGDDSVDFKTFEKAKLDVSRNSSFSLLREIATKSDPTLKDIREASSVQELIHIVPRDKPDVLKNNTRVDIATVARHKNSNSSLKSFLVKNTQNLEEEEPVLKKKMETASTSLSKPSTSFEFKVNNKEKTSDEKKDLPEEKVAHKENKKFGSLFKSTAASEYRGTKTESLLDLYKRLLTY